MEELNGAVWTSEKITEMTLSQEEQIATIEKQIGIAKIKGLNDHIETFKAVISLIKRGYAEVWGVTEAGDPVIRITDLGQQIDCDATIH